MCLQVASTTAIYESYNDPHLHILTNNSIMEVFSALSRGLTHPRGKYVARIDAEDVALLERLAEQVWLLGYRSEVALVTSATELSTRMARRFPSKILF